MIDYHQFCQIKDLHAREGLKAAQIAGVLGLDPKTVAYWLRQERFRPRRSAPRASQLDPFKAQIRQSSLQGSKGDAREVPLQRGQV
jgi:hypothetical protein